MRKGLLIAVRTAVLTVLFAVSRAYTHPPADISLAYDPKTSLLTAVITHDTTGSFVKDTTKHFVRDIRVSVNGKTVITHLLSAQENMKSETAAYRLRLKSGDRVSVTGACNIFGSRESELIIP